MAQTHIDSVIFKNSNGDKATDARLHTLADGCGYVKTQTIIIERGGKK